MSIVDENKKKLAEAKAGNRGPHFNSENNSNSENDHSTTQATAKFDEKLETCIFEKDAVLEPEATLSQKTMMLGAIVVPTIGLIVAIMWCWQNGFMGWSYLAMFFIGWMMTALGITIGFHRLMSHKSFETYRSVRAFWMCLGAMSVEGAPLIWCAVHRRHHSCSDQHGDPHSPHLHDGGFWNVVKGFWYAQVGWLFAGYWSYPNEEKYIPDLLKDKLLVNLSNFYVVFIVISLAIPTGIGYLIGGGKGAMLGLLWGGLVRVFWTHHMTWAINSVCHIWGKRDYQSNDHSTNNWFCGLLAWGEGWHNNHHAFPSSARHGLKWWQVDVSWMIIRAMKVCGLAWNLKLPSERAMEAKKMN